MSVLIVVEHLRGQVREVTFELVTAARELGGPATALVIASDPASLDVACEGLDEILHVPVEQDAFESDVYRNVVEEVIAEHPFDFVLAGLTVNAMSWAPALSIGIDAGFASDVFALCLSDGCVTATRAFLGGKVHADITFPARRPIVLLLRPATWQPATQGGSAKISERSVKATRSRTRHCDFLDTPRDGVDITSADFLLTVGRGIRDRENLEQFERLADKLGATLAVSRPLVDAGWMPNSRQVGQSGKTVRPKIYLALGISGAVQHLAGMKSSGTIIAVNTDPEAAIFGIAHYGAIADLFDIAKELDRIA